MHIGFDATAIPANRAGAGIYIFNLVKHLAQGDAANRYTIFAAPQFIAEFNMARPNVDMVPVPCTSVRQRLIWEQTGLPREICSRKIQVLHSPHYTMPMRPGCASVVTFCDMTFFTLPELHDRMRRWLMRALIRRSARCADRLIAISESTRQDTLRVLGVSPARICTIPLAASAAFRRLPQPEVECVCARHGLTPDGFLLFVGVLEPRKNVPTLLQAYADIVKEFPDIPLVIAGKKGWMYDAIFQRVADLGIQDRVRFTGYLPLDDLVALYNAARAFVYPSFYEGFGLPVLEALQCGTPVITSNLSSMPEVAGDAALLVSPRDVTALAGALRQMLTDGDLARHLSQQGLERAKQFSWERCARETVQVYQSLSAD